MTRGSRGMPRAAARPGVAWARFPEPSLGASRMVSPALELSRTSRRSLACLLLPVLASAQGPSTLQPAPRLPGLVCDRATRVADPKLSDGAVRVAFHLNPPTVSANALVEVLANGTPIATPWSGTLYSGSTPTEVAWDGR